MWLILLYYAKPHPMGVDRNLSESADSELSIMKGVTMSIAAGKAEKKTLPFGIDVKNPQNLSSQIASGICNCIASGIYDIGDVLPTRCVISKCLGVSECVVKTAFASLTAMHLISGRPRRGHVVIGKSVPQTKTVLDVSVENRGSYSSSVCRVECLRCIADSGNIGIPLVLGMDQNAKGYLSALKQMLEQKPDLVILHTNASFRKTVVRMIADSGCAYTTVTMGTVRASPGRFVGEFKIEGRDAVLEFVRDCARANVSSVLQVDFGKDSIIDVSSALRGRNINVERMAVGVSGFDDLDEIVKRACGMMQKRLARGCLPDVIVVLDDYLALGALEALKRADISVPRDVGLVVYANVGSGLFPYADMTRFEYDPRQAGRVIGRSVVSWLRTGVQETNLIKHAYFRGMSFPQTFGRFGR